MRRSGAWRRHDRAALAADGVLSAGDAGTAGRRDAARRDADRPLSLARERQGPGGRALDARAARRDARVARPQRAAGARADGRARALLRSRHDRRPVLQEGPRVLPAHAQGRAAGEAVHAARRRGACCCSIRSRSIRPGKTKLGAIVPNRDASKLAVGIYAKGSEIQDFRIIDSLTGAADRPADHGRALVRLGARRALRVTCRRARRSPMRGRSRTSAIAIGLAAIARTTSC